MSHSSERQADTLGAWLFGFGLLALIGLGVLIRPRPMCGHGGMSEVSLAEAHLTTFFSALNEYALREGGRYPSRLEALVEPDEDGTTFLGRKRLPLDPWDRSFVYTMYGDGAGFSLLTLGADGKTGGTGKNEDLSVVCIPQHLEVVD